MIDKTNACRTFLQLTGPGMLSFASPTSRTAASTDALPPEIIAPPAPYPNEPPPSSGASLANIWFRAGLVRQDIRPNMSREGLVASGLKLDLLLRLQSFKPRPMPVSGVAVYIWHCDASGAYSVYGRNDVDYLRGIGISDSHGRLRFTTIFPGTYRGREPHIHFEIYPSLDAIPKPTNCILRSRILFPETISREVYRRNLVYRPSLKQFDELVFGRPNPTIDTPSQGQQGALVSGHPRIGIRASIAVALPGSAR